MAEEWMDNDVSETQSNSSDAANFWDSVLDSRIDHVGHAPAPQDYPSATTSSIQAIDAEAQALQATMDAIGSRCVEEEQALIEFVRALREHREQEEDAILYSVATLYHHRNALVTIARLPPEILSQIFMFHAEMEWHELTAALTTSHVCRRWREIALTCPGLWTRINCEHSGTWIATMIDRSRSMPLSLTIGSRWRMGARKNALVADNTRRFKRLDLDIPYDEVRSSFELFTEPVALLKSLKLSSSASYQPLAFPLDFLGGSAPNLRYFTLRTGSHVPWRSPLFTNLVSLDVNDYQENDTPVPDASALEELLLSLMRMPSLEFLTLRYCLPPPAASTAGYAHVDLPNLRRLNIAGSLVKCTSFLQLVTVPVSAAVLINLQSPNVSEEAFHEFFTALPHALRTTAPIPACALTLDCPHSYEFRVERWRVKQGGVAETATAADVLITFKWEARSLATSPAWACYEAFASSHLRALRVSEKFVGWDAKVWRNVGRISPGLQRLASRSPAQCVEICKALRLPEGQELAPADCGFPALSYLEIAARYNEPMAAPDGGETVLSEVLPRWLAARAKIGCPTPELVFIVPWDKYPDGWSQPFVDAVPDIVVRADFGW